jgi:flagellar motor switch protein FliM
MAERKAEIAPQKRTLKLSTAIGDWTTYKPSRTLVKKIKIGLYGFDRLSGSELELAHLIHYLFGQELLKYSKKNLGLGGELYSVDAFQNTYVSFLRNVHGPLFQGKILLPSFHDEIFLSFDLPVAESFINAALGSHDTKPFNRGLTEAEEMVMESLFEDVLKLLNSAFFGVLQSPEFKPVSSPDLLPNPSITPQTTFVFFTIEVALGEVLGKIILGYNGPLIKNLLKLAQEKNQAKPLSLNKLSPQILNNVVVPLIASVGQTQLTTKEISALEVGDVVSLDNSVYNAIDLKLAGLKKILGQPGEKEGKLSVRVVSVGEKEAKETRVAPPEIKEVGKETLKATAGKPAPPPAPKAPPSPLKPPAFMAKKPFPPLEDIEEEEEEEELEEDFEEEFPEEDFEDEEFLEEDEEDEENEEDEEKEDEE